MTYKTDQEIFWAGKFGDEYISRNKSRNQISANVALWTEILSHIDKVDSFFELGCNIGLNLLALKEINPSFKLGGVEINRQAYQIAKKSNFGEVILDSILNPLPKKSYDLCFTSGVLIHINPLELSKVYNNLIQKSKKYVVVIENYNPFPTEVIYRKNKDKLFKRDFAGELIDKYRLKLKAYGFVYHRDNYFPQDDINWFILEKND